MSEPYRPPYPFRRTSRYATRTDPVTGKEKFHAGEDWAAPAGTPIPAATPGEVVYSGFNPGFGNTVIVRTTNGYSLYAHMNEVPKVGWDSRFGREILSAELGIRAHFREEIIFTIRSLRMVHQRAKAKSASKSMKIIRRIQHCSTRRSGTRTKCCRLTEPRSDRTARVTQQPWPALVARQVHFHFPNSNRLLA